MGRVSLEQEIEKARQRLNILEELYGIDHEKVLEQSIVLDALINEYNRKYYAHEN